MPLPPDPVTTQRFSVYVVGAGTGGRVKIGTTTNLDQRVGDISRMSPVQLKLLWSTEGGRGLERALHGEFAAQRLHGEWFDFGDTDPVLAVSGAVSRIHKANCPDYHDSVSRRKTPDADPVGLAEIARRLGVQRDTVDKWRARNLLPEPTWPSVGGRPAWNWPAIETWARDTGRLPGKDPT